MGVCQLIVIGTGSQVSGEKNDREDDSLYRVRTVVERERHVWEVAAGFDSCALTAPCTDLPRDGNRGRSWRRSSQGERPRARREMDISVVEILRAALSCSSQEGLRFGEFCQSVARKVILRIIAARKPSLWKPFHRPRLEPAALCRICLLGASFLSDGIDDDLMKFKRSSGIGKLVGDKDTPTFAAGLAPAHLD